MTNKKAKATKKARKTNNQWFDFSKCINWDAVNNWDEDTRKEVLKILEKVK